MQIQAFRPTPAVAGKVSKSGAEMSTCCSLNSLASELRGLDEKELASTSVIEYTGQGASKEYVAFCLCTGPQRPRCPHEPVPMTNKALQTMVGHLLSHYGDKAKKKELAFLNDGLPQPGYTQVTLSGTGLGLYFETATGKPMGQLTGSL